MPAMPKMPSTLKILRGTPSGTNFISPRIYPFIFFKHPYGDSENQLETEEPNPGENRLEGYSFQR